MLEVNSLLCHKAIRPRADRLRADSTLFFGGKLRFTENTNACQKARKQAHGGHFDTVAAPKREESSVMSTKR